MTAFRFVLPALLPIVLTYAAAGKGWYPNSNSSTPTWADVAVGPNDVGRQQAIAIDAQGHAHVAYVDWTSQKLFYAYYDGVEWSTSFVAGPQVSDTASSQLSSLWGSHLHILLESNGGAPGGPTPVIFFRENSSASLQCATLNNGNWSIKTVYTNASFTGPEDVVRDAQGRYVVSFSLNRGGGQYDQYCGVWDGATFNTVKVDSNGSRSSVAIDAAGTIHIGYVDPVAQHMRYAALNGSLNIVTPPTTVDGAAQVARRPLVFIDGQGQASLLYRKGQLPPEMRMATKVGGSWNVSVVFVDNTLSLTGPLAAESDGNGALHVAYAYNFSGSYQMFYGVLDSGGSWTAQPLTNPGTGSGRADMALDGCGQAHVVYYDGPTTDLKCVREAGCRRLHRGPRKRAVRADSLWLGAIVRWTQSVPGPDPAPSSSVTQGVGDRWWVELLG